MNMGTNMKENKVKENRIPNENKMKRWIDSPETRDILSNSVSKCFINIPQEKNKFKLRRMHTIDSADLVYGPKLYELPEIEKINMNSSENKQSSSERKKNKDCSYETKGRTRCLMDKKPEPTISSPIVPMDNNDDYDDNIPSFGTQFHEKGTCNPCRYEWTRGCHMGKFCRFCHHSSHVPIGTARVVPDPKTLATTKVRPENILTNQKIASYAETLNSLVEAKSQNNLHSDRTKANNNFQLVGHITNDNHSNSITHNDDSSNNGYSVSKRLQSLSMLSSDSNKKKTYKKNNHYAGPYNLKSIDTIYIPCLEFSNYMNDYDQSIYNCSNNNPHVYTTIKEYILPNALVDNIPKNAIIKIVKPVNPFIRSYVIQSITS
ncbi:zinc finger protein, putative [Plasmodium vinckei lentum]|uniref:Zinc finger protein, putative n=1 Tax=Plasmodium vinckei lentum TaxID=138297 RepID=A0A6V7RWV5_PLAVN|nr:zinc finger protein, putative [Plasmodium vinckei lentum]